MTINKHTGLGASTALSALFIGSVGLTQVAAAAEYKIYSPHVEQGESEAGFRIFYNLDDKEEVDNSRVYKFTLAHAFTDFWASELNAEVEHEDGESARMEAVEWTNLFQITPQGKYWADLGFFTEAAIAVRDDDPNEFTFGPLIEKSFGRAVATINLLGVQEFGSHAENKLEFSYAARLRYRLNPLFEPAIEAYGSPGAFGDIAPGDDQRHQIGPGFYGQTHLGHDEQEIKYSAAAVRGLTNDGSPDWTLIARFEYVF